jgi:glycerophosphoryl diester phosphodiesterase
MNACLGLKVNVEIKNIPTEAGYDASGSLAHQVVRELADLAFPDDIIISSFDLATCDMVRAADGDLAVGWLLHWALETGPCIVEAAEHGLQAVHPYFVRVKRDDVDTAHTRGIAVNVWTVNEKSDISAMLELGVDTIITDDPALALATASRPAHG